MRPPDLPLHRDEAAACGIGFFASRKGVAERKLVDVALKLCRQYDHRGAPGHGAGLQLDIPWALLLDRFPEHARVIANRDVALGMFFLPFDGARRAHCVEMVEDLASLADAEVLGWADVPVDIEALPAGSSARRTAPVVRQALFRRPEGLSEDGWLASRYLLRLALDEVLSEEMGDDFTLCSLSNRTVVYKGLAELSRIAALYPDLTEEHFVSRFVLFHSRYSTNTTTAWRRAQPFWSLAHNGEIATIRGNVAWMHAIGRDLIARLTERYPNLRRIAGRVQSIICAGGSDTANLDDMLISLLVGGLSLPQAVTALLPEAPTLAKERPGLLDFQQSMSVLLGACDGPAAIVACDGDEAVAHLDRNGLRPLWLLTTPDYAVAASELTRTLEVLGDVETQRLFGPGDTAVVRLSSGEVLQTDEVRKLVAGRPFPRPAERIEGQSCGGGMPPPEHALPALQVAFGMTREDADVVLAPLIGSGKLAVGSMGDDTPPAAILDTLPRRIDDYFKLRFAQETSPPIDPIRDAWVFETGVALGDRSGLWSEASGPHFVFPRRILSQGQLCWLGGQPGVNRFDATFPIEGGAEALERALDRAVAAAVEQARQSVVLVVSDRGVGPTRAALPGLRLLSRLHDAIVRAGFRHRVGIVADLGVWDVHHCALLVALGADAVSPWLGALTAGDGEATYLEGLRTGFVEAMSMTGVTPAWGYCGAKLVETVGLDPDFVEAEFPGVAHHLGGIGREVVDAEWLSFHGQAFGAGAAPVDAGEFRFRREGRPHFNEPRVVKAVHGAAGYAKKSTSRAGSAEEYATLSRLVSERHPITPLDLVRVRQAEPIPLEEVEPEEDILWRFMAAGMSDGALSEPAHRAVARAMNALDRLCRRRFARSGRELPPGIGPFANSGEGGFDKSRIGGPDGTRSIQYAGGRFTITPMTAALADEAEVKFAQGAKPGKGGQLPGRKVDARIAHQRGCEPGYELISPPINHNLYSIEDVKLMIESWRHLNPKVSAALKYVATDGVALVCLGGVNAGANRLNLSDGAGGTGAAKRVDQKHAGVPVAAVLPHVQDVLVEEGVRAHVELSVDGGVQTGEQALKLALLGADRIGFGTSLLMALGCSMLRQCHLAGPLPGEPPHSPRRMGCTPGVATQDPRLVARFRGRSRHVTAYLMHVARDMRERMARAGIRRLRDVIGRRDLLERRADLTGKAALIDVSRLTSAPTGRERDRRYAEQSEIHAPRRRVRELELVDRAIAGESVESRGRLTNRDRCVGVAAAGEIARRFGDAGLPEGRLLLRHHGAAGHFYGAYAVTGMELRMEGLVADSAFTAAYGGKVVIIPDGNGRRRHDLTVAGNAFGYGARAGSAYLAGRAGNRFAIALRKSHEGGGPRLVVEGVEANAFQYMTGGVALVLGSTGYNLGSGMTGGVVYLLDADTSMLNTGYVGADPLDEAAEEEVKQLLREHAAETRSRTARALLDAFDPDRFTRVTTRLEPEPVH